MNCWCNMSFDLRCVCYPQDYRKLKKYEGDRVGDFRKCDFRKCPIRIQSAIAFIDNDCDLYTYIYEGETEKIRIRRLKEVIVKKYKLSLSDFKKILEEMMDQVDNIINNKQEEDEQDGATL